MPPTEKMQQPLGIPPPRHQSFPVSGTTIVGASILVVAAGFLIYWFGGYAPVNDSGVQTSDTHRPLTIGILSLRQVNEANGGFRQRLAELGYDNVRYIEHEDVPTPTLEEDFRAFTQQLLDQGADLIFANYESQARAALNATREAGRQDVPVIFISRLHDPVTFGLAQSFQSSSNNATGVAADIITLIQRHLDFIKQIDPNATRLGIFARGFQVPGVAAEYYDELKRQVPRFGIEIVEYTTDEPPPNAKKEFDRIAATIQKGDIDALMHIGGHYYVTQEAGESKLAMRLGIPMATNWEDIPRGGHFTFSNGTFESGEQAAVQADKILRGAKPSEIPIEYAQKGILSLHLGRAREAGFGFPESMLFIAENKFEDDSQFPEFEDR